MAHMNNSNNKTRFTKTISTPLEPEVFEKLNRIRKKERVPMTHITRRAIDMFLNKDQEIIE